MTIFIINSLSQEIAKPLSLIIDQVLITCIFPDSLKTRKQYVFYRLFYQIIARYHIFSKSFEKTMYSLLTGMNVF